MCENIVQWNGAHTTEFIEFVCGTYILLDWVCLYTNRGSIRVRLHCNTTKGCCVSERKQYSRPKMLTFFCAPETESYWQPAKRNFSCTDINLYAVIRNRITSFIERFHFISSYIRRLSIEHIMCLLRIYFDGRNFVIIHFDMIRSDC